MRVVRLACAHLALEEAPRTTRISATLSVLDARPFRTPVHLSYDSHTIPGTIPERFRHESDTNPTRFRNDFDTIPKQRKELFTKETFHEWSINLPTCLLHKERAQSKAILLHPRKLADPPFVCHQNQSTKNGPLCRASSSPCASLRACRP